MVRLVLHILLALATQELIDASASEQLTPRHECVHDKIAVRDIPFISERSLSHSEIIVQYSKIRITPHFLDQEQPFNDALYNKLRDNNGPLCKAIELVSRILRVRPLSNNLTLPPMCSRHITSGANNGKCSEITQSAKCGIVDVPIEFVGTTTVCSEHNDTSPCYEDGPNAPGVATDFLLFVQIDSDHQHCGEWTYAFSSTCAKDYYRRPTAGYLNLCTENLIRGTEAEIIDTLLFNLVLHELIHVLGFSKHQLADFHDGNLNFYLPYVSGQYNGTEIRGLNSPKVLQVARSYYGCSDLPFVPLENNGGASAINSHWEARVLHHEVMVAFIPNDYAVLSNFTLAFFEDTGWYKVDYAEAQHFEQFQLLWGKGLGCRFVLEPCTKETYPYLCDVHQQHQCSYDLVSKGRCESSFFYFDGCPVVLPDAKSSCLYPSNTPEPNTSSEVFGLSSMCVEASSSPEQAVAPKCYEYSTTGDSKSSLSLNSETYSCSVCEGGNVSCPPADRIKMLLSLKSASSADNTMTVTGNGVVWSRQMSLAVFIGLLGTVLIVIVTVVVGVMIYTRRKSVSTHEVDPESQIAQAVTVIVDAELPSVCSSIESDCTISPSIHTTPVE